MCVYLRNDISHDVIFLTMNTELNRKRRFDENRSEHLFGVIKTYTHYFNTAITVLCITV